METKDVVGILAILISMTGYCSYLWSIKQGKARPHVFSWMVWSLLLGIVFFAQLSDAGGAGSWATGASAFMCSLIAGAALKRGEKNITFSDWLAFLGALIAIPVWYFSKNPLMAVILATLIDALAYYPTYRKSWHKPFEENILTYAFDVLKWVVSMFALGHYSAITLMYPIFLIAANSALVAMVMLRRKKLAPKKL